MLRFVGGVFALLLSFSVAADIPSHLRLTLVKNPDNTFDTVYRTGNKPPNQATLLCDDSAAPALTNIQTGTPYSEDVRQYYSGTAAATCTLSLATVSGDNAATKNWSLDGDDLENTSANPGSIGSGALQIGCTDSGNTLLCSPRQWQITAPPAGDSTAPTIPAGLTGTAGTNQVTFAWRASMDPYDGDPCSGIQNYDLDISGTVVQVAGPDGLCPELTQSIIGDSDGTPASTQTGNNWALSFGGAGFDDGTDQFLFRGASVTGDFKLRAKVTALASTADFEKTFLHWRESTDVGARGCWWSYQGNGKIQARCRTTPDASPGSMAVNATASLPAYLEIEKSGNDTIFRHSSDADGDDLTEVARLSNPSSATVLAGMGITATSAGTNATATIEEFALSQSADLSYTHNTTSTVTGRVRARDDDNNVSAYTGTVSVTPDVTAPSSGTYKWHPGHYILGGTGTTVQGRKDLCTEAETLGTQWKGIQVRIKWNELQADTGAYTFGNLIDLVDHCATKGKRVMLEVWWRSFGGGTVPNDLIPEYVKDIGGNDAGIYYTGDGWAAAIWREAIMDEVILLYQALGAALDSKANFEMISTKETSAGGGATSVSDYSPSAYVAQMKRLMTEIRASWPTTIIRIMSNYITAGSATQIKELVDHGTTTLGGFSFGGPDPCPTPSCPDTWLHDVLKGETGGHDYRGEAIIVTNAEDVSMAQTMDTLYTRSVTTLETSHISWMRYTGWNPNYQESLWEPDIKPYILANPTTASTCPSSITCDTSN